MVYEGHLSLDSGLCAITLVTSFFYLSVKESYVRSGRSVKRSLIAGRCRE